MVLRGEWPSDFQVWLRSERLRRDYNKTPRGPLRHFSSQPWSQSWSFLSPDGFPHLVISYWWNGYLSTSDITFRFFALIHENKFHFPPTVQYKVMAILSFPVISISKSNSSSKNKTKQNPEHVTICFQVHRWLLSAHLVKWEHRLLTLHVFTSISPCPVAIVRPLIPKSDDT